MSEDITVRVAEANYRDAGKGIGGLKRELGLMREIIELPLRHPELSDKLGTEHPWME